MRLRNLSMSPLHKSIAMATPAWLSLLTTRRWPIHVIERCSRRTSCKRRTINPNISIAISFSTDQPPQPSADSHHPSEDRASSSNKSNLTSNKIECPTRSRRDRGHILRAENCRELTFNLCMSSACLKSFVLKSQCKFSVSLVRRPNPSTTTTCDVSKRRFADFSDSLW